MVIRELVTLLSMKQDTAEFKKAMENVDRVKSSLDKLSGQLLGVGTKMSLALTAPFTALTALSVDAASDFIEVDSKFGEVFKGIREQAELTAASVAKNFGLSESHTKEYLSATGDLLTGLDFTREKALEVSQGIVELSADLVSFKNIQGGPARASSAITSGLLGNVMALKSLGIAVGEEDIKLQKLKFTQEGITFETERQTKAMAILEIIKSRSRNSIGDLARTSESFSNVQRKVTERLNDLAVKVGKILMPQAAKLLGWTRDIVEKLIGLDARVWKIILAIGGFVAVIGPLLIALGAFIGVLPILMGMVQGLAAGMAILSTVSWASIIPWLLYAALFAAIILIIEDVWAAFEGGESVFKNMGDWLSENLSFWDTFINGLTEVEMIVWNLIKALGNLLTLDFSSMMANFSEIGDSFNNLGLGGGAEGYASYQASRGLASNLPPSSLGGGGSNLQQANNVNVTVDAREMSPTEASEAVRTGVETGLLDSLKKANQQIKPGVSY